MQTVDFEFRKEIIKEDLSLSYCYQCGTCSSICPVALATDGEYNPRKIIEIPERNSSPKSEVPFHEHSLKEKNNLIPKAKDLENYKAFVFKRLREIEAILAKKFP